MKMESVKRQEDKKMNIEDLLEIFDRIRISDTLKSSEDTSNKKIVLNWLEDFLKTHDLSPRKIITAWSSNARPQPYDAKNKDIYTEQEAREDLIFIITKNIACIKKIELKYPGIVKYLNENYGIQNFGRFSAETWIAQYENKESSAPFGLAVIARDDWNGSSYNENSYETYEDLRLKLQPDHSLKIIEAKDLPQLAKLLTNTSQKQKESPEFVIWSGHGGEEFFLGPALYRKRNYKFSISKEDFEDEALKRMQPYLDLFSKDTVMILDACGQENKKEDNLITTASSVMGNKFIYPKGKTSVKSFGLTKGKDGKLSFNVKYNFGAETNILKEKNTSEKK